MASLRKNVSGQGFSYQLNATANGSPVTSGGAGNVTIDNGSQTACAGTFTHKGGGQWWYAPTQAETNGASIGFQLTGTGAIAINLHFFTDNWDTTKAVVTSGSGTDQLTVSSGLVALTTAGNNAAADALLARNIEGGSSAGRIVSEALYPLRDKWTNSGGTYTVYKTDDTTIAWTSTTTADPTAQPLVGSDPA